MNQKGYFNQEIKIALAVFCIVIMCSFRFWGLQHSYKSGFGGMVETYYTPSPLVYWYGDWMMVNGFYRPLISTLYWVSTHFWGMNQTPPFIYNSLMLGTVGALLSLLLMRRGGVDSGMTILISTAFTMSLYLQRISLEPDIVTDLMVCACLEIILLWPSVMNIVIWSIMAILSKETGFVVLVMGIFMLARKKSRAYIFLGMLGLLYVIFWKIFIDDHTKDGIFTWYKVPAQFIFPLIPIGHGENFCYENLHLFGAFFPSVVGIMLLWTTGLSTKYIKVEYVLVWILNAVLLYTYPFMWRLYVLPILVLFLSIDYQRFKTISQIALILLLVHGAFMRGEAFLIYKAYNDKPDAIQEMLRIRWNDYPKSRPYIEKYMVEHPDIQK